MAERPPSPRRNDHFQAGSGEAVELYRFAVEDLQRVALPRRNLLARSWSVGKHSASEDSRQAVEHLARRESPTAC